MQKPQDVTFKKKSSTWSTFLTHKTIKHSNLFKIYENSHPSTKYPKILVPTTQILNSATKNKRMQSIDNQWQRASPYSKRQRGGARKEARRPERTSSDPNHDTRHQIDRKAVPDRVNKQRSEEEEQEEGLFYINIYKKNTFT